MIALPLKPLLLSGVFFLAAAAFAAWMKATKGRRGEKAVHNAIVAAGAECVTDFIIPDNRGGLGAVDI